MSSDDFRKDSQDFNKSGDTENNGIISQAKKSGQDKLQNKIALERKESIKLYDGLSLRKSEIENKLLDYFRESVDLVKFIEALVLSGKSEGSFPLKFSDCGTLFSHLIRYNRDASKAAFPRTNRKISEISISETIENYLKSEGATEVEALLEGDVYYCDDLHFFRTVRVVPLYCVKRRCNAKAHRISEPIRIPINSDLTGAEIRSLLSALSLQFSIHINID